MAIAVFTSFQQVCDNSGDPLNGGSVTVYQAGTTTPIQLYNDDDLAGGHEATNPITLDAYGRHAITYFSTQSYKVLVKDSGGSTIYTRDNIDPGVPVGTGALPIANGGTASTTAAAALAALGGATAAELADVAADVAALSGTLASTEKTHIATGTTAQRTGSPVEGDIRRNTTTSKWEGYNGSNWENAAVFLTSSSAPTVQRLTSGTSQTYTTPSNCKLLRVRMVGGGGGGGAATTNAGSNGNDSSFGTWTAIKGNGGAVGGNSAAGGAGGSAGTDGTGTLIMRSPGGAGGPGYSYASGSTGSGQGGCSIFAGGGKGGISAAGSNGGTNTGGGGGGGNNAGLAGGAGGGAGESVEFFVSSPSATYTYTVGAGGNGGSAGGQAGGNGAAGVIIVEEFYVG